MRLRRITFHGIILRGSLDLHRIGWLYNHINTDRSLIMVIPCSFHSCLKQSLDDHRGISEFRSDDRVIHESVRIDNS